MLHMQQNSPHQSKSVSWFYIIGMSIALLG